MIPGLGRSPGGGNSNLLQYSCLESPMDRGAWWATVHGVTKSQIRVSIHTSHTLRVHAHSLMYLLGLNPEQSGFSPLSAFSTVPTEWLSGSAPSGTQHCPAFLFCSFRYQLGAGIIRRLIYSHVLQKIGKTRLLQNMMVGFRGSTYPKKSETETERN